MIFSDILKEVDFDEFRQIYSSNYLRKKELTGEPYTQAELDIVKEKLCRYYEDIRAIEPHSDRPGILVVMKIYDDLYDEETDDISDKEIYDVSLFDPKAPDFYAIDLMDWADIVSCEVSEMSIEKYGKAAVAAHIYYEMTFFGNIKSEHDERIAEVIESLEQSIKESEDPDSGRYYTLKELREELGIKDERTEEEIEAERQKTARIIDENRKIKDIFMLSLKQQAT